ncbi:MAG: KUP/HAK/KT family potassium transporter [Deltaproteobacteria bacterium]
MNKGKTLTTSHVNGESFWGGVIKSMGLVFGDIGTSPIYTLTVIFALTAPTLPNVFGIISLVFWTITILVTVEYAWLAMSLNRNGQGGAIVLREILISFLKSGKKTSIIGLITFAGISLLLGDGVITPAISILSAVEGMLLVPGLEIINQSTLVLIAAIITIGLFAIQKKGADKIAWSFGPLMVVWFLSLAISGIVSIIDAPSIVGAVNPYYAFSFLKNNGLAGFIVLSEVILCSTGGEALYADMGHLGRKPIINAWYFVFVALVLNYIGQGAFILNHPDSKNILFEMVKCQVSFLYIPFLILTIVATIIASQAMISGVFSIIYQGITTRLLPLFKITYTSNKLKSQIYIGAVNWMLMFAVLLMLVMFRASSNLANAYGLAVIGSMTLTCVMMVLIFIHYKKTSRLKIIAAMLVLIVDIAFFVATLHKIPSGAYWALLIASIPFATILVWVRGQKLLFRALRPLDIDTFLVGYEQIYSRNRNIVGTALFFSRDWRMVSPYLVHCILRDNIIYERNIFISIIVTEEPHGLQVNMFPNIAIGLEAIEIKVGYMEVVDIEEILKQNNIYPKVIFYGIEEITTKNPVWKVFGFIKRLSSNFVQFHKLPPTKLHGIVTRVEI